MYSKIFLFYIFLVSKVFSCGGSDPGYRQYGGYSQEKTSKTYRNWESRQDPEINRQCDVYQDRAQRESF